MAISMGGLGTSMEVTEGGGEEGEEVLEAGALPQFPTAPSARVGSPKRDAEAPAEEKGPKRASGSLGPTGSSLGSLPSIAEGGEAPMELEKLPEAGVGEDAASEADSSICGYQADAPLPQ